MLSIGQASLLWEDPTRGLRLVVKREPSQALLRQIDQTRFGTHGLRYRRLGVDEQLRRLPKALYFELNRDSRLVGTYLMVPLALEADGHSIDGYYRGHLTVHPDARGQGLGQILVKQSLAWLGRRMDESGRPAISYGCIERKNLRSMGLLTSLGVRELGHLHTQNVYRQWPRPRVAFDVLGRSEQNLIRDALSHAPADCGLCDRSEPTGSYCAVTDDAGIVAGAQTRMICIDMERIGGVWDFMSDRVFKHIPAARRRFDRHNFCYLSLSQVVVRAGQERVWRDLLSSLLARYALHMGVFIVDPRSRAAARLAQAGVFGPLARATRQEVAVLGTAWNVPPSTLEALTRRPLAVYPIDM